MNPVTRDSMTAHGDLPSLVLGESQLGSAPRTPRIVFRWRLSMIMAFVAPWSLASGTPYSSVFPLVCGNPSSTRRKPWGAPRAGWHQVRGTRRGTNRIHYSSSHLLATLAGAVWVVGMTVSIQPVRLARRLRIDRTGAATRFSRGKGRFRESLPRKEESDAAVR